MFIMSRIVAKLNVVLSFLNKTKIFITLTYIHSKPKDSKKVKNEFDNSFNSYRIHNGNYG